MGSHFKSSHPDAKKELPKGLLFASVFLDLNVLYVTPSQTLPSGRAFCQGGSGNALLAPACGLFGASLQVGRRPVPRIGLQ
jgi:hypothetical protein